MHYHVKGFRTGRLKLRGKTIFSAHDPEGVYDFTMYVWLLTGGDAPILVDTGPKSIAELNRALAKMTVEPIVQDEGEDVLDILASEGVSPEDIGAVLFTHLHYDHCSNADLFPNAVLYPSGKGVAEAVARLDTGGCWVPGEVIYPMMEEWKSRVHLCGEDEAVLPGIRMRWLGGHTPCSQAIIVDTSAGPVALVGDTIFTYKNLELDDPINVCESVEECRAAMAWARESGALILPGHDPEILARYPGGVVV